MGRTPRSSVSAAPGSFATAGPALARLRQLGYALILVTNQAGIAKGFYGGRLGLGVMVGNMVGSSLAMAPAFVLGQGCDIVDLDGPTFLAEDRMPSVVYHSGTITAGPEVWGSGRVSVA